MGMAIADIVKRGRREQSLAARNGLLLYCSPVVAHVRSKFFYSYYHRSSMLLEKLKFFEILL